MSQCSGPDCSHPSHLKDSLNPKVQKEVEVARALAKARAGGHLSRNALCHCGSGIKYKKCCYQKDKQPKLSEADDGISKSFHNTRLAAALAFGAKFGSKVPVRLTKSLARKAAKKYHNEQMSRKEVIERLASEKREELLSKESLSPETLASVEKGLEQARNGQFSTRPFREHDYVGPKMLDQGDCETVCDTCGRIDSNHMVAKLCACSGTFIFREKSNEHSVQQSVTSGEESVLPSVESVRGNDGDGVSPEST